MLRRTFLKFFGLAPLVPKSLVSSEEPAAIHYDPAPKSVTLGTTGSEFIAEAAEQIDIGQFVAFNEEGLMVRYANNSHYELTGVALGVSGKDVYFQPVLWTHG